MKVIKISVCESLFVFMRSFGFWNYTTALVKVYDFKSLTPSYTVKSHIYTRLL